MEFTDRQHPFRALHTIEVADLDQRERSSVPQWWLDTQESDDPVGVALAAWGTHMAGALGRTRRFVRDHVTDVRLCRARLGSGATAVVLAYVFDGQAGHFHHGFGLAPLTDTELPRFRAGIEPGLRDYYTRVHNGFFQAIPIGLMPAQNMLDVSTLGGPDDFDFAQRRGTGFGIEYFEVAEEGRPDFTQLVGIVRSVTDGGVLLDVRDSSGRFWELWGNEFECFSDRTLWESVDDVLIGMLGGSDDY